MSRTKRNKTLDLPSYQVRRIHENDPPTWRDLKWIHSDKLDFMIKSPPRFIIRQGNRKERRNYKKQYHKWLRNPSYEIISQIKIRDSASWYWY